MQPDVGTTENGEPVERASGYASEALTMHDRWSRLVVLCLRDHICWKVLSEDRMDPPIHTEYFRSGGAITLIFIVDGASAVSSFVMRSPMPRYIVVPPESTTLA